MFAECFNRTIRDFLKRPAFLTGDGKWIDVLPTMTKQYNRRNHSAIKAPIQAPLKRNESSVHQKIMDKRRKMKRNFKIHDFVRTTDLRKTFPREDTTSWSFKLYEITEIFHDTKPSYRIDNLQERHNEALLKKTK